MKRYRRQFTLDDQLAFARLSGDFNPMHVDALVARRYMFGQPVVHGIHTLLWALDAWCETRDGALDLRSVKVDFVKPTLLNEPITAQVVSESSGGCEIHVRSGETVCSKIVVSVGPVTVDSRKGPRDAGFIDAFPLRREPRIAMESDLQGLHGSTELYLENAESTRLFPHLAAAFSGQRIAIMLNTSRVVGVDCPGLNSLYSSLELAFNNEVARPLLDYAVAKVDRRFNLIHMTLDTPSATGSIRAFLRPAPVDQPSYVDLQAFVDPGEFVGQTALVIGASRGLGEVAGKLLAAGGASVRATYHQGEADACRIVADIVSHGGRADHARLNVLDPNADLASISRDGWTPTHCYYFATPFIFSGTRGVFSADLFGKFSAFYVTAFAAVVDYWRAANVNSFFYPSTVAIDETPLNMGEYSAAKAAGETLCEFLERSFPALNIHRPRFPRVATDQTVSVVPVKSQDPVVLMLAELRAFRDASVKPS